MYQLDQIRQKLYYFRTFPYLQRSRNQSSIKAMENSLKNEVLALISTLKESGKEALAAKIEANWQKTLLSYSKSLSTHKASRPIEKILVQAFSKELARLNYKKSEVSKILGYLGRHRFLQTTPHIAVAEKPRFFFINYFSSLGLSKNDFYPVAMFSGIPFSNKTRPGRLCKSDGDVNLIPSSMQDDLVYGSKITPEIYKNISNLEPALLKLLPKAKLGMDFTIWAIKATQKLEQKFLRGKPVFFDFNEVMRHYFLLALEDPVHPITRLLFFAEARSQLERAFENEIFFYRPYLNGKFAETDSYHLQNGALQSKKNKIILTKESLKRELRENNLCVGLPLGFLVYSFLNEFLCGGSFAQTEYLPIYKEKFSSIPFLKNIIAKSPTGALTTGGFKDDIGLHPLDLHLGKKVDLKKYEQTLFGEAILAVKDVLLYQNYSTKYDKAEKKEGKNTKPKAHFIGIAGKGMSGLAIMLKEEGYVVTGSDEGFYEPVTAMLKKNGINFITSYKKENIPEDTDFIIIGKHAKLIPETNEEARAAFASGITIKSLPEAIGDLVKGKENTVVVGSYGKSTMTGLISYILSDAGKDPSYFIGAVPLNLKQNAKLGKGKEFIIEGDEYPSANWDHTSKFLHLNPTNGILISGEHDHLNVFPTEKEYIEPYKKFVKLLPKKGLLVASSTGKNVKNISKLSRALVVFYGLKDKTSYHAENIIYGEQTSFDLYKGKVKIVNLKTSLLGEHNIENIIGAAAFVLEKKLVKKEELSKAVGSFLGISGRLDLKNPGGAIPVYEGFGSSYPKARSVFDAIKLHHPDKKIIAIFEPHTFSWRNRDSLAWYKTVFEGVSEVILLPPPEHGKNSHDQLSFDEIYSEVKKHVSTHQAHTEQEALNILKNLVTNDSVIALVSSGSLLGLTESVPTLLAYAKVA